MKNKASITFISVIALIFIFIFIYWKWESYRSDKSGSEQNNKINFLYKFYTRLELDNIFSNDINNEEQIVPFFGVPTQKKYLDIPNKEILYVYSYSPKLLERTDKSKYGTGIKITCRNGKVIHWDILELAIASKVYTADELDKLIHHGLTSAEVKNIFGEPEDISRVEGLVIYYYKFPAKDVEKKNGSIPIGINIMFIDDKVVNWGIVRVVYSG